MRLSKLELHGFKSFADNTQLLFEDGVTAIVGPNGCGKSNVSDAVRWVLGEQRARALRGAKMDEVIFQGSSARRPVSVAEVSLHFDNDEGLLPVPFREVVITRRLSRSGESHYFLNRAPCRLRDIQDLLRGTGLGGDTGVVIEARAIDALLSDRPDDRRELFEEAAGVGLYRDRRRSTERRLEETTVDLSRLDDLLAEVQSQVRSLARQRRRAERSAELTKRRFDVEVTLAGRVLETQRAASGDLESRIGELRESAPRAGEQVTVAESTRETAHARRMGAEAGRNELARLTSTQREQVAQLRGEMAVAEERRRNAQSRRERAELERREGEALGVRVVSDREAAAQELAALVAEEAASAQQLEARVAEEEQARNLVASARSEVDQAERGLRELHEQLRRCELDRESGERELADVVQRAATLETELSHVQDRLDASSRELGQATEAAEAARETVKNTDSELASAREAAKAAREREAGARAELARTEERVAALQGKMNALESLERERVGLAPAAARLLKDRAQFGEKAVIGPLSDFIDASQSSALLVERFLGVNLHAVLVRDRAVAEDIRRWHARANPGPLLLLPLDSIPDIEANASLPAAELNTLAARVSAHGEARSWVRALLGGVNTSDDGTSFVDSRGAVWLPGAVSGPGPLRRRAELGELRGALNESQSARELIAAEADELRTALQTADRAATAAADAAAAAHRDSRRAEEHRVEAERRHQRIGRELAEANAMMERLVKRRSDLQERVKALVERSTELEANRSSAEERSGAGRTKLQEAATLHESAREARSAAQVAMAQLQARLHVSQDRERRLAQEFATAEERMASLEKELTTLSSADDQLSEQMSAWKLELGTREARLKDGESHLAAAEKELLESDEALTNAEHSLSEIRRQASALAEALHQAELEYTELAGNQRSIRERLETEWRRPLEELLEMANPVEVDDETLRAEADSLRQEVESLGPVNPLAIEEHDEEVRRLEFLTTQRDDLSHARNSLQQAIREIDATARELFLATFAQVRENFRQIFMSLFGGGECDLRLENPEAPLDCDIEIHASPRGKRTQRIHLLSSGERALVALSLLFGIFLTKPSPFCLLDEVDAPLDDQNIGRFVRMLNQFKENTQFIVITHNPRTTTEAADAVYGVTMQEPGVSSVVGVRVRNQNGSGRNGTSPELKPDLEEAEV
ncbi:MAG TPA: chromosome segregation protein SMC [Gemmatimonadales bacterium]|nr:chromosome segregation protein SMC [Gemmatimonadales bacterium]